MPYSDQIIGRIDEMGSRIDDLEKSIGELMEQVSVPDLNTDLPSVAIALAVIAG